MTAITTEGYVGIAGRNELFNVPNATVPYNINALDGHDLIGGYNAADILFGGLGRDFMFGRAGNDAIYGDQSWNDETTNANALLAATADLILGEGGSDTIFAGGGNNFVNGGAGDDYIIGGSGNELLQGGSGNDSVYGAAGNDTLVGGTLSSADNAAFLNNNIGTVTTNFDGLNDSAQDLDSMASGSAAVDLALTGTGNDYLDGGLGDDRLYGGDGADTMIGGFGNDSYTVDNASDLVIEREAEGVDEVYLDITLSLHSYIENVTLTNSTEGVLGNALANRINGNASANYLAGAEGNDTITGGLGADRLIGGSGADTYVYNAVNEGGDRVLDFSSSDDTFHFNASAFGGLPTGQPDGSRFSSSNGDTAPNSSVRFFYEEDTRVLRYDADGIDSAFMPVIIATLQEGANFSISDIVLI
jgi:Ca2+-binding RTX toxin-like protein